MHLSGMSNAGVTCKTSGTPLPPTVGKSRNRVYCGGVCRNVAYLDGRGVAPVVKRHDGSRT